MEKIARNFLIVSVVLVVVILPMWYYFFDCGGYSNHIKYKLDKINQPCQTDEDCQLRNYYACKPYCMNKNVFETKEWKDFYPNLGRGFPIMCPLVSCISPHENYVCVCENNACTIRECYGCGGDFMSACEKWYTNNCQLDDSSDNIPDNVCETYKIWKNTGLCDYETIAKACGCKS